jgi:hypothetical protein
MGLSSIAIALAIASPAVLAAPKPEPAATDVTVLERIIVTATAAPVAVGDAVATVSVIDAAIGRWNHRYRVSTWTSERTWQPLPRREYTTRSDSQLLNVENRHSITPAGWTHEQDHTKVVRRNGCDTVLVREFGFKNYHLITGYDFGPGQRYWEETALFWDAVRARWDAALAQPFIRLNYPANGENFLIDMLARAENVCQDRDLAAAINLDRCALRDRQQKVCIQPS